MSKVIIVGNPQTVATAEIINNLKNDGIEVVESFEKNPFTNIEPYIISNPYPELHTIENNKQFICKGKHQYRESGKTEISKGIYKTEWICQCGRKL